MAVGQLERERSTDRPNPRREQEVALSQSIRAGQLAFAKLQDFERRLGRGRLDRLPLEEFIATYSSTAIVKYSPFKNEDATFEPHQDRPEALIATFTDGKSAFDDLVQTNLPLVKFFANGLFYGAANTLSSNLSFDDLVGAGTIGLVEMAAKFDSSNNNTFNTFASTRIRGEMIDVLRKASHVPKDAQQHLRKINNAINNHFVVEGVQPTLEELIELTELSRDQIQDAKSWERIFSIPFDFLERPSKDNDEGNVFFDGHFADPDRYIYPEAILELKADSGDVSRALACLLPREKRLITLYYKEGWTLTQIKDELGVSDTRASQIHQAALIRMRRFIDLHRKLGIVADTNSRPLQNNHHES